MPIPPKGWKNDPDHSTPIDETGLKDLETRLGAYADSVVAGEATSRKNEIASQIAAEKTAREKRDAELLVLIQNLGGGTPGEPAGSKLQFGINSNSSKGHAALWTGSKVFLDRSNTLDVLYNASPESVSAAVAASLAAGCHPLLIINTDDEVVLGKINAASYAAGALAIIERVKKDHPAIQNFQLINEPYYKGSQIKEGGVGTVGHGSKIGSNASVYATILKATYEAVEKAGLLNSVTLLVEAFGEFNTYADLVHEEKQEKSGIFKHWVKDICFGLKDPVGLALGDSFTEYANNNGIENGWMESFQFTATKTQTAKQIRFRTNGVANTGVTSVVLGVAEDAAGKPGAILGQATFTGEPGTNTWISVSGVSISLVSGTKYWLIVLPLGTAGKSLHFATSKTKGLGEPNLESKVGGFTKIETGTWETTTPNKRGPVGFQCGIELEVSVAEKINGWSNHPYGSLGAANGEGNFNWGSTEGFRTIITEKKAGGNNNWWLTEFGWQGEATQNERMKGFLEKSLAAREAGWLTAIVNYDDGDGEWSIYNKPAGLVYREFAEAHG